ncbi:hypothetical protein QAD02_006309 [Eretmocerus hayati]|uniref:Uncharacterized protein n=1 Tax=Eretmocerus hayati TaxID=131215 RepID=A0ACC2N2T8_9HYME|nr:hypothetical protein QAD02_006309 [Eretmocerus hayati]
MDAQVDAKYNAFKSKLSSKQKKLLETVESGKVTQVEDLINKLSKRELQAKSLDYVLLTTALKRKHKSLVRFLLKFGCRAKIAKKTNFHSTPLHYVYEESDPRLAGELMKSGASIHDTDVNDKSFLEYALIKKQHGMIDLLLLNLKSIHQHESLDPNRRENIALFHLACFKHNPQALRIFLNCGFSVNSRSTFDDVDDWNGFTSLHFVLSSFETYTVKSSVDLILKHDVDFSAQDKKGRTPVHLAFRNKYPGYTYSSRDSNLPKKWLKYFMNKEFSNLEDKGGLSYFHIISCGLDDNEALKYMKAVQYFLDKGVEINKSVSHEDENYPGYTALHFAVRNLRDDIAKLLLDNGADITKTNKDGMSPLHVACNISVPPNTRTDYYVKNNEKASRLKVVELLLEYAANIDAKDLLNRTAIHLAFSNKDKGAPITRLLISKSHFKKNLTDETGLSYLHIASSENLSTVKTLVERGAAEFSDDDRKNIKEQFENQHLEIIELLLQNGADVHARDCKGQSILHHIATQDECTLTTSIAEMMLKKGADVNAVDERGLAPLHIAIQTTQSGLANLPLVTLFCEYGANVSITAPEFGTPLHIAVEKYSHGRERAQQFFDCMLNHPEIQLNAQNAAGDTPLHVAAKKCISSEYCLPYLEFLLNAGADINIENSEGLPPLDRLCDKTMDKLEFEDPRDYYDFAVPPVTHYVKVSKVIIAHIRKLMKMNSFVSRKVREKYVTLLEICPEDGKTINAAIRKELDKLKSQMINQHTSLYHLLFKDASDMVNFVNNQELKKIIASPELRTDFPMYHNVLTQQFKRGLLRKPILEEAKIVLSLVTQFNWPDICALHILKYLSHGDLKILIKSVPATKNPQNCHQDSPPERESRSKRPRRK